MASQIDQQQIKHVAELAKLEFNDAELDKFTPQLGSIIDMFEELQEQNTDGVDPMYSPTDRVNVMREDVAVKSNDRDALLKNAPDTDGGLIKVPAIMDDESEDGE